jgi:hypothetical protein
MVTKLEIPITRHWLESMSSDELIKLADSYGIDIPHGLERIFIIEEILDISGAVRQENAGDMEENPAYSETALLPKQYNISYIEVIIRDPLWVFAFWEVKKHDREIHENADDFNGYCLKVIPLDEDKKEKSPNENPFTIPVDAEDCARYLGIVEHSSQNSDCYLLKLCVNKGDTLLTIAASHPFYLPKPVENDTVTDLSRNPLIRLSGVQEISITKNTDRLSKVKREQ